MRVAVLAHELFPDQAKTAVGILRYADYDVVAVLDRDHAGERVRDHVADVQDAPIVASMADVTDPVDALVVGIAPVGGGFDESWRPDVRVALERGCDVVSGLHYLLSTDAEFRGLAEENGGDLLDVRDPPDDLSVSEGRAGDVDADVVLTVGTDCSVGKMTTTLELVEAARERGYEAGFVPTGQTGIMIAGDGIAVDRVVSDFAAGAVERMILDRVADPERDYDYLFVEGQGSVLHPAYSGVTCSLLHGSMPDAMVLCHAAGRETTLGYGDVALPPLEAFVDCYETLGRPVHETRVAAGALNTDGMDEAAAREAVSAYGDALGVPTTDPLRSDAGELLDAL